MAEKIFSKSELGNIELNIIYFSPSSIELHLLDNSSKNQRCCQWLGLKSPSLKSCFCVHHRRAHLCKRAGGECTDMHAGLRTNATTGYAGADLSFQTVSFCFRSFLSLICFHPSLEFLQLSVCKLPITLWGSLVYGLTEAKGRSSFWMTHKTNCGKCGKSSHRRLLPSCVLIQFATLLFSLVTNVLMSDIIAVWLLTIQINMDFIAPRTTENCW